MSARAHRARDTIESPEVAPALPSRGKWWRMLVLVAVGVLTYANSLSNPFVLDDKDTILNNESIRQLSLGTLAPEHELPVAGRPTVNVSLALNYAVSGDSPRGFRVVNLSIHLICGLLLFLAMQLLLDASGVTHLRQRSADVAFAIALLWLLHPLNSEVVNYISQRTESMMAVFCVLTLYAFLRDARRGTGGWSAWKTLAVVACALGMGSKESMVVAPLLVLLTDRVFLSGSLRAALTTRWQLYAALAATWIILAVLLWFEPRSGSAGFGAGVSAWTYLLNQAPLITRYLSLAVWPTGLVSNYGWPAAVTLRDVWPQATLIVALLALTIYGLLRYPKLGFLGAWFFITLAPASSIVPIMTEVGAERRMYLPVVAVIGLIVIGALYAWHRWRPLLATGVASGQAVAALLLIGVSTASALETAGRNEEYRSELGLAQLSIDRYPNAAARHSLAERLLEAGQRDEAMRQLRLAVDGAPRAHYTLGLELYKDGNVDEAVTHLKAFVEQQPNLDYALAARGLLGEIYQMRGEWADSVPQFQAILKINPRHAPATRGLADAYLALERYREAIELYGRYLLDSGNDAHALNQLGLAFGATGQTDQAIKTLQLAITVDDKHAPAHHNLALALWQSGRIDEALIHARHAAQLQPDDAESQEMFRRLLIANGKTR